MNSTAKQGVSATMTAAHFVPRAILLSTYLEQVYGGDEEQFAADNKFPLINVRRWLAKDAIVFSDKVYLKASKGKESHRALSLRQKALASGTTLAMSLQQYIAVHCENKQTVFADMHNFSQQQSNRWANRDCVILFNQVYRMQQALLAPTSRATLN